LTIQKTLFKDGDPVSSQLIFTGAIQTCTIHFFIHIYENNTSSSDKHNLHFHTKTYP